MIKKIKGFTLIELLVVIAIIGILSAVVIGNLNDARNSGKDASAKATMSSIRAEAEIFYDSASSTYAGACAAGEDVDVLLTAAEGAVGGGIAGDCFEDGTGLAASIELNSGEFFCVDSTGYAGTLATDPVLAAGNVTCL